MYRAEIAVKWKPFLCPVSCMQGCLFVELGHKQTGNVDQHELVPCVDMKLHYEPAMLGQLKCSNWLSQITKRA